MLIEHKRLFIHWSSIKLRSVTSFSKITVNNILQKFENNESLSIFWALESPEMISQVFKSVL